MSDKTHQLTNPIERLRIEHSLTVQLLDSYIANPNFHALGVGQDSPAPLYNYFRELARQILDNIHSEVEEALKDAGASFDGMDERGMREAQAIIHSLLQNNNDGNERPN